MHAINFLRCYEFTLGHVHNDRPIIQLSRGGSNVFQARPQFSFLLAAANSCDDLDFDLVMKYPDLAPGWQSLRGGEARPQDAKLAKGLGYDLARFATYATGKETLPRLCCPSLRLASLARVRG